MQIQTRYKIFQKDVTDVRSFPIITEIPYLMKHHKQRLNSIDDIIAIVSNKSHLSPLSIHFNTFHNHQTAYAAIDALAPPLAEFFEKSGILPIIFPIAKKFKSDFENLSPKLSIMFVERGILIATEDWQ